MRTFIFRMASKIKLTIGEPTTKECIGITNPCNSEELTSTAESYLSKNLEGISVRESIAPADIIALQVRLRAWLEIIKQDQAYCAPPVQSTAQNEIPYHCTTLSVKAVAEYGRMSFLEVYSLPITEFWKLYRDAIIWNYSLTNEGIEKLKAAKVISTVEPDREKLGSMPQVIRRRSNGKQEN